MKKIILATSILILASCQEKSNPLSREKIFLVESKDSVLGCFQFAGRDLSTIRFEKRGKKYGENPSFNWDLDLHIVKSGDSIFLNQKYPDLEKSQFLTLVEENGDLKESLLIESINKNDLFDLRTIIDKVKVKN